MDTQGVATGEHLPAHGAGHVEVTLEVYPLQVVGHLRLVPVRELAQRTVVGPCTLVLPHVRVQVVRPTQRHVTT